MSGWRVALARTRTRPRDLAQDGRDRWASIEALTG